MKNIIKKRISRLREEMQSEKIDAYIILTDDFHGSEYVSDYFKCREYMSGFDGSAGTLVVSDSEAGLFTDGRYFIQAEEQLRDTGIKLYRIGEAGVPDILSFLDEITRKLPNPRIGFDGKTVSDAYASRLEKKLSYAELVKSIDLVGRIWDDRPKFPHGKAWLLDEKYSGESAESKLSRIRAAMSDKMAEYNLIAALDDIAWTFNMRGCDISYNPVAMAYALIGENSAVIYMAEDALGCEEKSALSKIGVTFKPYEDIYQDVKRLNGSVLIDSNTVNTRLVSSFGPDVKVIKADNPSKILKAVKNETEQANEVEAHIKDGVALTKLCFWLKNLEKGNMPTEMEVADKLEEFRSQADDYLGQSFAPIIAAGEHGAIVHYEADEESNIPLERNNFVLMDTGGHYLQGTTDVTRTLAIGNVSEEQKVHYTAVLCGNLNIGGAFFKEGVTGNNLDYLARVTLWELGLDYNHGTGHGVGYLLNVHEGPNAIRLKNANTPFEPGMITSNEPGVYLEGRYGIRLENLVLCVPSEEGFLEFDTLTLVPFDRDAILPEMLDERQLLLLNLYHQRVYHEISPYLTEEESRWLNWATQPL